MKSWNYQNELHLEHVVALNVLKDSKRDARTLNTIKQWAPTSCSKPRNFCRIHKLVVRDHQMAVKLMINCTLPRWMEEEDGYKLVWHSLTHVILPWQWSASWWTAAWFRLETRLIHVTLSQLNFLFLKWKPPLKRRFSNTVNIRKNILAKLDAVPLDIFNHLFIQLFEIHKNVLQSKEFSLKKNKTLFYCMCIHSYGINPQIWPHALRMASWNSYRMTQRMFVEVCNILTY